MAAPSPAEARRATGECSAAISLYGEAAITMNAGTVGVPAAQAAGYGLALSGGADIALLKGGSVFGPSAGIATFGGADGVIEITMTGGSVAGGTAGAGMCLTSAEGASVASQCTISGGSVTGGAGIVSLGTTLAISNGGITATSSAPVNVGDATAEGSSAEIAYVPAAVVVSAQRGYAQPSASAGSCAITGGTFVAAEGIPAIAYQSGQYQAALPSAPAASGTIDVSTGHFSSTLETSYLNSKIEVVAEAASGEAPYTYWPTSAAADAGAPGAPSTLVHPLPVNVNGLGSVSQRIAVAADGVKTYSLIAVTEPYGSTFRGWQNQYGTIVSTQSPYSVVLAEGETAPVYTAVFEGGSVAAPEDSVTVFRIYNPYNGQHLLTTDQAEVRANVNRGWEEEGTAFYAPVEGPVDVYRLYNPYRASRLSAGSQTTGARPSSSARVRAPRPSTSSSTPTRLPAPTTGPPTPTSTPCSPPSAGGKRT